MQSASDDSPMSGMNEYTIDRERRRSITSPSMSQPRVPPTLVLEHAVPEMFGAAQVPSLAPWGPNTAMRPGPSMTVTSTTGSYPSLLVDRLTPEMTVYGGGFPLQEGHSVHDTLSVPAMRTLPPQLAVIELPETFSESPTPNRLFVNLAPPATSFGSWPGCATRDFSHTSLSTDIRSAIPSYIEIYWERVHPLYPIIHKATVEHLLEREGDYIDVLRCAMAAVATQFLGHRDHRINGSQLHAYAWHKSNMVSTNIA